MPGAVSSRLPPAVAPLILLLEDEQAIADTLLYVLRSEGFDVRHERLARDARAALAERLPALAILDVGLPDVDADWCKDAYDMAALQQIKGEI